MGVRDLDAISVHLALAYIYAPLSSLVQETRRVFEGTAAMSSIAGMDKVRFTAAIAPVAWAAAFGGIAWRPYPTGAHASHTALPPHPHSLTLYRARPLYDNNRPP